MKTTAILALLLAAIACPQSAAADMFGSGEDTFEIDFVMIGDPGNAPDTAGNPNPAGSVPYYYRMGKYEISERMIEIANELGDLGITKFTRGPNKPATGITWFEAARFVNWLNVDAGAPPAYKFDSEGDFQLWEPGDAGDAGYDPDNAYRNRLAKYFLPGVHEWYKAAYYDPVNEVYYKFPTGSNDTPDGIDFEGDTEFDAVFIDGEYAFYSPHDITEVGVSSPLGTMGQGGNVWEWEETYLDTLTEPPSHNFDARGYRGGSWSVLTTNRSGYLASSVRFGSTPFRESQLHGFRVASIPEPSTLVIGAVAMLGSCLLRLERKASLS